LPFGDAYRLFEKEWQVMCKHFYRVFGVEITGRADHYSVRRRLLKERVDVVVKGGVLQPFGVGAFADIFFARIDHSYHLNIRIECIQLAKKPLDALSETHYRKSLCHFPP